ncbi:MAG TPA: GNAT family N-acetyltransferase [Kofleriaceae bacterium]|nr:GNAT family N-acetyltransferase [Kofleriaceae bacterium]
MGYRIDWTSDAGQLSAFEPTPDEVAQFAAALSRGYNDPRNAELMGHAEPIEPDEVIELYADAAADGVRSFLLFQAGDFAGDGDLRGIRGGTAEFAFMIGAPSAQGKGLGTRFATMIHAFGFATLGLHHIYASIVPANTASRRVFDKLGYALDASAVARGYADEPGDLVMSIDRPTFERVAGGAVAQIAITSR